jgi:serine/threonine protein kinase
MGLGKQSLYDRLRECQKKGLTALPVDELLNYMDDAAKGIDYLNKPLHDMGQGRQAPVVHSDIKPHNILIVGDGAAVCDFGLARAVEVLRMSVISPGTLAYAAPESFRKVLHENTDQYSFAITYVELRTGFLPFDENMTGYEVMRCHVDGELDFSRLSPAEAKVIRRATHKQPHKRWPNCRTMVVELRRAVDEGEKSTSRLLPAVFALPGRVFAPLHSLVRLRGQPAVRPAPSNVPDFKRRDWTPRPVGTATPQDLVETQKSPGPEANAVEPPSRSPRISNSAKLIASLLVLFGIIGLGFVIQGRGPKEDPGTGVAQKPEVPDIEDKRGHDLPSKDSQRNDSSDRVIEHKTQRPQIPPAASLPIPDPIAQAIDALRHEPAGSRKLEETILKLPDLLSATQQRGNLAAALAEAVRRGAATPDQGARLFHKYRDEQGVSTHVATFLVRTIPPRLQQIRDLQTDSQVLLLDCDFVRKHLEKNQPIPAEIRAFHAEALLSAPGPLTRERLSKAAEVLGANDTSPYFNYVRAQLQAALEPLPWNGIRESLQLVFLDQEPHPYLTLRPRAEKAVELLNRLAVHTCETSGGAFLVNEPYKSAIKDNPAAQGVYPLLRNADAHFGDLAPLDDHALACLALSAAWSDKSGDVRLVQDSTKRLLDRWQNGDDSKWGRNLVLAVYYTHWRGHEKTQRAEHELVSAARRIIRLGELPGMQLTNAEAASLYGQVLKLTTKAATKLSDHQYFAELAEFIRRYPSQVFAENTDSLSIADRIEPLYTVAIGLSRPGRAEYFFRRGEARLEKANVNVAGALEDADAMERLRASPQSVKWLRGYAHFLSSRQRETTRDKLADLALAETELAKLPGFETPSRSPKARSDATAEANVALLLSMIHLEQGNYSRTLDQGRVYGLAVDYGVMAEQLASQIAVGDQQNNPALIVSLRERAFHAQGNAYEDLAYIAKEEPRDSNYSSAIKAFGNAYALRSSSTMKMALGRCYYRILAESDELKDGKLEPRSVRFLQLGLTRAQVLQAQTQELKNALDQEDQWDSASLAEAHHWLGRMYQVGKLSDILTASAARDDMSPQLFEAADKHLLRAATLADENGLPNMRRAMYSLAWAEHALFNPNKNDAAKDVARRAEYLARLEIEPTVDFDREQEANLLKAKGAMNFEPPATILSSHEAINDARKHLHDREPARATRSDIKVLRLLSELRRRIAREQRDTITRTETAKAAKDDAVWLAEVPAGLCYPGDKASAFNAAQYFYGALVLRLASTDLSTKLSYRKQQTECWQRATEADWRNGDLLNRYDELHAIWGNIYYKDFHGYPPSTAADSLQNLLKRRDLTVETAQLGRSISMIFGRRLQDAKSANSLLNKLRQHKKSIDERVTELDVLVTNLNHSIALRQPNQKPAVQ